jgi:hypothetical protein
MKRMFGLIVAVMFMVMCVPAVFGAVNINLSSEGWNDVADSVLLRVRGLNADSTSTQRFGVVACNRDAADGTASISLMRIPQTPSEIITSSNDSEAGQPIGNIAFTTSRSLAEGANETVLVVLTAPQLSGVINAGWQIGLEGFRGFSNVILDTFNTNGSPPVIMIGSEGRGCGVDLFPSFLEVEEVEVEEVETCSCSCNCQDGTRPTFTATRTQDCRDFCPDQCTDRKVISFSTTCTDEPPLVSSEP